MVQKATNPDATVKSYLWKQSDGPKVNLSAANTANPTFIALHVLSFTLKVTDNEGANSTNFSSTKVIVKHVKD